MKKISLHRHENDPNIGQGGRREDGGSNKGGR